MVLHYTEMDSAAAARDRLCDPASGVSAHYLIGRDGTLWPLVAEEARAWHSGAGAWAGRGDVNSRSIGIELDNDGASPFSAPLMARLESLLADILGRWGIAPAGVIAHSDMAPERKRDPGPRFDWRRLARQGLAVWPDGARPVPPDPAGFTAALDRIGYPAGERDLRLAAFRLRFRPWARGPLDAHDMGAALALLRSD